MTVVELSKYIDKSAKLMTGLGDLSMNVWITDAKAVWGNVRLKVVADSGSGSCWVDLSSLREIGGVS